MTASDNWLSATSQARYNGLAPALAAADNGLKIYLIHFHGQETLVHCQNIPSNSQSIGFCFQLNYMYIYLSQQTQEPGVSSLRLKQLLLSYPCEPNTPFWHSYEMAIFYFYLDISRIIEGPSATKKYLQIKKTKQKKYLCTKRKS